MFSLASTRATFGAALVAASIVFMSAPVRADGALVLGIPANIVNDGFSYGYRVNAETRRQARESA